VVLDRGYPIEVYPFLTFLSDALSLKFVRIGLFILVRELNDKGVSVEFVKENMIFTAGKEDPRPTLMFTMLSAFAQLRGR
jgi:hypothetical protein